MKKKYLMLTIFFIIIILCGCSNNNKVCKVEKNNIKTTYTFKYNKNTLKLDKVPEWFDKQIEKQEITKEEKKQLEDILKEYN